MKKSVKTLCLIMFVTLFTFSLTSQNVKAYTSSDSLNVDYTASTTYRGGNQITSGRMYTQFTGNVRGIFYKISDEELTEIYGENASKYSNCYVFFTNDYHYGTKTETLSNVGDLYFQEAKVNEYNYALVSWINNKLGTDYCGAYLSCGFSDMREGYPSEGSFSLNGSVDYVDSIENVRKYLIDKDDSVVINGDPNSPPVTQDNSLPVPQSLTCDIHNKYTGSNPFLIGGWSNPANASFDAIKDTVKIHIQYKPRFQYYKRFLSVKDEVVSSRNWIDLGTVDNNNKNKWINCFPNTPQTENNIIKFETLQSDMQTIATINNLYSGGATIDNGSSWRVRYEMPDGRVSYWSVYNIKAIGKVSYADDVTFQDNEDNVVSSDAVSYQNSNQTDPENQDRDNSLLGRLKNALNNMQSLPKDMQNVADEGSSFANFLKKVWDKFPEIYILFIGGLIIAIILRILGR